MACSPIAIAAQVLIYYANNKGISKGKKLCPLCENELGQRKDYKEIMAAYKYAPLLTNAFKQSGGCCVGPLVGCFLGSLHKTKRFCCCCKCRSCRCCTDEEELETPKPVKAGINKANPIESRVQTPTSRLPPRPKAPSNNTTRQSQRSAMDDYKAKRKEGSKKYEARPEGNLRPHEAPRAATQFDHRGEKLRAESESRRRYEQNGDKVYVGASRTSESNQSEGGSSAPRGQSDKWVKRH